MKLTDLKEATDSDKKYAELKSPEFRELVLRTAAHRLASELEDENLEVWYHDNNSSPSAKIHRLMRATAAELLQDVMTDIKNESDLDKVFKKLYPKEYNIMTGVHS